MKHFRKYTKLVLLAISFIMLAAPMSFAMTTDDTTCVDNQYGQNAVTDPAADTSFTVLWCNFRNAALGFVGATLAVIMIGFGIYQGAFAKGGALAVVPPIIMGLFIPLSPRIVGWLGVSVDYARMMM